MARTVVSLVLITKRRRVTACRQVAFITSKPLPRSLENTRL